MIGPARTAALEALRAVSIGGQDLPAALARTRPLLADERDRALATEIVTGTLRWQRRLDHIAGAVARRPAHTIDPEVLLVLRLSLYQILHLDRVPAAAVVDDAVNLVRRTRRSSAAGFVNAVLRSTLRQRHRLPLPPPPGPAATPEEVTRYLAIVHSHPDWLVRRWLDRHGLGDTERWLRFNNDPPSLTLRVNTLKATRDDLQAALREAGVETAPTRYAPFGLTVVAGNPLRLPPDGRFVVQDEASQLVALLVSARPGDIVLDLCASPGGKTGAMAADMSDAGVLVACDVRPRRLRILRASVEMSGARSIRIVQVPSYGRLPFQSAFDRVVVDAPCSGLGTLRRDPDIKWKRREEELPALSRRQVELLTRAAESVRPGGSLVYATCSSEPEENEEVVRAFLAVQTAFVLETGGDSWPLAPALRDTSGFFRTLPFAHGLEAFFGAVMTRRR